MINQIEPEKVLFRATICFLKKGNEVLLAKKTRKIGAGKWNGYGGGIDQDETPLQSAKRELQEECGIDINTEKTKQVAIVDFYNTKEDGEKFCCRCDIFIITDWVGEIKETDEMITPTWFPITDLPLEEMMPADPDWVPLAIDDSIGLFKANAYYGPRQSHLIKKTEIQFVDEL